GFETPRSQRQSRSRPKRCQASALQRVAPLLGDKRLDAAFVCGDLTVLQKLNFSPNWISRGPRVAVIRPKFGLSGLPKFSSPATLSRPRPAAILLKFAWLKALNISARN